jgi:carbonic anhydrase/acetyltransferase-like protein (isoleucine patch superfamily)
MFNTRPWLYYDSQFTNKFTNTYIQGILDISGNIILRNGGFSLPQGDVSMNGNLYVGKQSTLIGDASMNGNIWVGKQSTLVGDVSMNGNVWVGKKTTLVGDVSMNGNVWVGKKTTLVGDVSMNGNLYVGLDASFNRNIFVKGTTNAITSDVTTVNSTTITLGGSNVQTTLTGLQTDITNLQTAIASTGGYFVLACEFNGNSTANAWFNFGANIGGTAINANYQVVMPDCILVGYRIECITAAGANISMLLYRNGVSTTVTMLSGQTVLQVTTGINVVFTLGDTFRIRYSSTAGSTGTGWRASVIFKHV